MTIQKEGVHLFASNDDEGRAIGGDLTSKDKREHDAAKREAAIPPFTLL